MFYVIGGSNIDIYSKSYNELIMKDSNPSKISFSFGGVARNISVNLSNLTSEISFITAFGNDYFADLLKNDLSSRGINLDYSVKSNIDSSSIYMAILNVDDMLLGMNDMSVLNKIDESVIDRLKDVVKDDDYVILDTNLDRKMIEYILNNLRGIKVCDAISANKVGKLDKLTDNINILKMNLLEASALAKKELKTSEDIKEYLLSLTSKNNEVLITGKDYVCVCANNEVIKFSHNVYNPNPVNVTGAGDALIGVYAYARSINMNIDEAISLALAASIKTVEVNDPVYQYDLTLLNKVVEDIKIKKENL